MHSKRMYLIQFQSQLYHFLMVVSTKYMDIFKDTNNPKKEKDITRCLFADYKCLLTFLSSKSFNVFDGSFTFDKKIIAAMIYGLKDASLYVWTRYLSNTEAATSPCSQDTSVMFAGK